MFNFLDSCLVLQSSALCNLIYLFITFQFRFVLFTLIKIEFRCKYKNYFVTLHTKSEKKCVKNFEQKSWIFWYNPILLKN